MNREQSRTLWWGLRMIAGFLLLMFAFPNKHSEPVPVSRLLLFLTVAAGISGMWGSPKRAQLSPQRWRLVWGLRVLAWVPIAWNLVPSAIHTGLLPMDLSTR